MAAFADRLTSRELLGARGASAMAFFPGIGTWSTGDCVTEWTRKDRSASIVRYERLELGRQPADACDQAQFGILSTTIRQSEGITPGALVARIAENFGPPDTHRDTGLSGSITYSWTILDGVFLHVEEPVRPGGSDEFSVLFMHSYAAPTFVPNAAEGEQWMDRAVALLTDSNLLAARGMGAVRLVDASLLPQSLDPAKCPVSYMSDLMAKHPIADSISLYLEQATPPYCGEARFDGLSFSVWQREPVTPAAMVARLQAKLGAPELRRDIQMNSLYYRWKTRHGAAVEVSQSMTSGGPQIFAARVWRE